MSTISNFCTIDNVLTTDPESFQPTANALQDLHGFDDGFQDTGIELLKKVKDAVEKASVQDGIVTLVKSDAAFWNQMIQSGPQDRVQMTSLLTLRIHGNTVLLDLANPEAPNKTVIDANLKDAVKVLTDAATANKLETENTARELAQAIGRHAGLSKIATEILERGVFLLLKTELSGETVKDVDRNTTTVLASTIDELFLESPIAGNTGPKALLTVLGALKLFRLEKKQADNKTNENHDNNA
ncbi:hypothetical protein L596_021478 [Steinernema carpocapsae]|uniref:Uncharacterized protein n=1 Tax=Steinernema carpocapsae TaxID=34508 RepID=A0A4U5MJ85_STECR|nr:hypothetical protein L596_021478 [Steinernema carpocapsae]